MARFSLYESEPSSRMKAGLHSYGVNTIATKVAKPWPNVQWSWCVVIVQVVLDSRPKVATARA